MTQNIVTMFNKLCYIIGGLRPVDVRRLNLEDSDTTIIQQLKLKNRFVEPLSVEDQKLKELAYKKNSKNKGFQVGALVLKTMVHTGRIGVPEKGASIKVCDST